MYFKNWSLIFTSESLRIEYLYLLTQYIGIEIHIKKKERNKFTNTKGVLENSFYVVKAREDSIEKSII